MTITALEVLPYAHLIANALAYAGGTHTVDDVEAEIAAERMQLWPCPHSVVVTEIVTYPRLRAIRIFLAAGVMEEIERITPVILDWGREQGCTRAEFVGRKGWARAFPASSGWTESGSIIMEREL